MTYSSTVNLDRHVRFIVLGRDIFTDQPLYQGRGEYCYILKTERRICWLVSPHLHLHPGVVAARAERVAAFLTLCIALLCFAWNFLSLASSATTVFPAPNQWADTAPPSSALTSFVFLLAGFELYAYFCEIPTGRPYICAFQRDHEQ